MEPATRDASEALGHTLTERANIGRLMGVIYDMETGLITGQQTPLALMAELLPINFH